jgi:KipI family sensor histidine kinase inhibitor
MTARRSVRIAPLGDAALLVELGRRVDTALNTRALALAAALRRRRDVREAVPGYASVAVHYDPEQVTYRGLAAAITRLVEAKPPPGPPGRLHRIPVVYDGPDLEATAAVLGLSMDELVRLHTGPTYRCFMIGFAPGWAYLGPLPERLRLPRRRVPRTHVPAGSVAMAGAQTGVYPLPTPGGWHLIGRTPVRMFLPQSDPPSLLRTGDRVKFFVAGSNGSSR